jgi:pimeloyl-ACP methyl ester carboxylesterase
VARARALGTGTAWDSWTTGRTRQQPWRRCAPTRRSTRLPSACSGTAKARSTRCGWRPTPIPGDEAVRWQGRQLAAVLPRPIRPLLRRFATRQLARLAAGTTDTARIAGTRVNARWWREQLAYDPRADLAAIQAPVLAITGAKDTQVDPDDLTTIAHLVRNVETHRTPGLTHVLRRTDGPGTVLSYRKLLREPVDTDLLTGVTRWLANHLR